MQTGKVKWFSAGKGYGFIIGDADGEEIFVHYSALQMEGYKKVGEGDVVEYEIAEGPKGPQAANVTVLEKADRRQPASSA